MRLSQKIALHTGIQVSGKILSLIVGFVSIGIMTRFLGIAGYGEYNTATTFLSFFGIIADLGLYLLLTREISRSRENQAEIASNIFTLRLVSAIVFIGISPLVAFFLPYSPEVKRAILVGTLAFVFLSLAQVLVGVFQKEFKTHITALGELISRVFFLLLLGWQFFYLKNTSLTLLVIDLGLSNLLYFLIIFYFGQKILKIRLRFDTRSWASLMKESFPIAISIVLNLIYFKIDTIMLSVMKSSADVGIYGVAYKILEVLIIFPAMFIGIMMPLFSQTITENFERFKTLTQRSLDFLIIAALPVVVGGYLLADPLVTLVGGQTFLASSAPLKILVIAVGVIFVGNLFGHLIIAAGAQKRMMKVYLFGAVLNVILNVYLIPSYSYIGSAFATVATELVVAALSIFIIKNSIQYLPNFRIAFKALAASVIMGVLFFYSLNFFTIFILLPVGVIVYFLSLYIMKGLPAGMFELFKAQK